MTLTDIEDMKTDKVDNKMDIEGALRDTLLGALPEGRLTCGVYESSKMLEMNPDGVMLCVLPENAVDDVTIHIHFTLIEAYCWENDIRVIKVDNSEKLCKLLSQSTRPALNDTDVLPNRTQSSTNSDFNCVLLEYPTTQCSTSEEDVMEFCKLTSDILPSPVVSLDV